jgi:hypothetical protein
VIRRPEGDVPIRTLIAVLLLAAAAPLASGAYTETHLNEIATPVAAYVTARVAQLQALPEPTKAEKKELKLLGKLAKKLAKTQFELKGDFAELAAAARTAGQLGAAGLPMAAPLGDAFARAGLSLSERSELTRDYVAQIVDPGHAAPVLSKLNAASAARTAAEAQTDLAKRAAGLVKADTLLTKALKKADRTVLADRGLEFVPPTRFRSGDLIGAGGGRVAVPLDANSPIAGTSIVIPLGVLPTPAAITLEPAADFVGGRDTPAGPAVTIHPDALAFGTPARLYLPYSLPDGANAQDLAVFVKGPPASTLAGAVPENNGTLSADVSALSTFQAGIAGPPPGQPSGAYHVQILACFTALDAAAQEHGGISVGVVDQTITFRTNHTGSTTPPSYTTIERAFKGAAPHHADAVQTPFPGSADFTWTQGVQGRFSYAIPSPVVGGPTVQVEGVASDDGRVIALSARGGTYEYAGVGVRGGTSAATADLAGRWAAVELGVELRDDGAEPFTTRWFDSFRTFTADAAGAVAFAPQGTRFETDVTYRTDEADPVHTRTENVVGDSGAETWTVQPSGRVLDATSHRGGWLDSAAGVLVSAFIDGPGRRVSLMVAVPQADTATPASLPGLYHLAQFEIGTGADTPASTTSSHDTTPSVGSLDVQSVTAATLAYEASSRTTYTLAGPAPITNIAWTMTSSSSALPASSSGLTLALDAAGNHTGLGEERWFAFETQGRVVLGLLRGEPTRLARGIAVGVR